MLMNDEELLKITDSITEKAGKDISATIADDLGLLITGNSNNLKAIQERDEKIKKLESDKEKLVSANANLLQQIPMGREESFKSQEEKEPAKPISLKDAFDSKGNFIK